MKEENQKETDSVCLEYQGQKVMYTDWVGIDVTTLDDSLCGAFVPPAKRSWQLAGNKVRSKVPEVCPTASLPVTEAGNGQVCVSPCPACPFQVSTHPDCTQLRTKTN